MKLDSAYWGFGAIYPWLAELDKTSGTLVGTDAGPDYLVIWPVCRWDLKLRNCLCTCRSLRKTCMDISSPVEWSLSWLVNWLSWMDETKTELWWNYDSFPPLTADRDILDMLCSFKYESIAETWCSRLYDANIEKIQTAAHVRTCEWPQKFTAFRCLRWNVSLWPCSQEPRKVKPWAVIVSTIGLWGCINLVLSKYCTNIIPPLYTVWY